MTSWSISSDVLRAEVHVMHDAVLATVEKHIPFERLRGVYFKGSASKPWYDPIDYVPELSDLDLHFWLADERDRALLTHASSAFRFTRAVNEAYLRACPSPRHWPRLQLSFVNDLLRMPRFATGQVIVVHGEPYPGLPPRPEDDRQAIVEQWAGAERSSEDWFDKVGPHQFAALRALSWRVTPTAPRLLHALGCPASVAWHEPRSVLVARLAERGHGEFAALYRAYFESAWRAFDRAWRDGDRLHETLTLGYEVLRAARDIAEASGDDSNA